jgi:hypothetical protein
MSLQRPVQTGVAKGSGRAFLPRRVGAGARRGPMIAIGLATETSPSSLFEQPRANCCFRARLDRSASREASRLALGVAGLCSTRTANLSTGSLMCR